MSQTIILKAVNPDAVDQTIILSGDTLQIVGMPVKFRIDKTDATRLLMFCEEVVKRPDFCESCGKPVARNNLSAFTDMKEYSRTLTIMGFRCVKCDLSGIAKGEFMITFNPVTAPNSVRIENVYLDGKKTGYIKRVNGGFCYQTQGRKHCGEVFKDIASVKRSLQHPKR